jgi:hypothetical protein
MVNTNVKYVKPISKYTGPKLITPVQSFPKIQSIEAVRTTDAVQPIYPYQGLDDKRRAYEHARQDKELQTFLSNYNDPTELNSFIDALTNREAVSEKFGETYGTISTTIGQTAVVIQIAAVALKAIAWAASLLLPDAGAVGVAGEVAGNAVSGAAIASKIGKAVDVAAKAAKYARRTAAVVAAPAITDVLVQTSIKPIIAGKPKEAGLNLLMNLGETVDYASNPIKGLILEGGEGFVKGLGASDEGRFNYNFDTGVFVVDMVLEMLTDPINSVQLGGGLPNGVALKGRALNKITKPLTQDLLDQSLKTLKETYPELVSKLTLEGQQKIFTKLKRTLNRVADRWNTAMADGFVKEAADIAKRSGKILDFNALSKKAKQEFIELAKKKMRAESANAVQNALIKQLKEQIPDLTASQIRIVLSKTNKEGIEAVALRSIIQQIEDFPFETLTSQVVKNLYSMVQVADAADKFFIKGALMSSGYGLGVEIFKDTFNVVKAMFNKRTRNNLKKFGDYIDGVGINILNYKGAKRRYKAMFKYYSGITGEPIHQNMDAFQNMIFQQFHRDQQFITLAMQSTTDPLKQAGHISGQIHELYKVDFNTYVEVIKQINEFEDGRFADYVKYLTNIQNTLKVHAVQKGLGNTIQSGASLFNIDELRIDNFVSKLYNVVKANKKGIDLTEALYTVKLNDAFVNAELVKDPVIFQVLTEISSDEQIGALLNKIKDDIGALAPEVAAQIPVAVRIIKEAGQSFLNIKTLYNDVAGLSLQKIKGLHAKNFKMYILDQIFGNTKPVTESLAGFDNITMPRFKNGLETLLADKGFKFTDYPGLEEQISTVYRRFLEAQQSAGVEKIGATIVQDFTQSIDDLVTNMPKFADELQELTVANIRIKTILNNVKNKNLEILENVFTTKNTIFGILNPRQLVNAGLALNIVSVVDSLKMFELVGNVPGPVMASANKLGAMLTDLVERFKQYKVWFNDTRSAKIAEAYKQFREWFLKDPNFLESMPVPAFRYLKDTTDPIEQFAQLVEFNKMSKDVANTQLFKNILFNTLGSEDYLNIVNPSRLLTTDFALDAMAQTAWLQKLQFNDDIINNINAYKNFSLGVQKAVSDFNAIRMTFNDTGLDRVKAIQLERYTKVATEQVELFDYVKDAIESRFNKTLATEQIENARTFLLENPEYAEKYSSLIDDLEAYWRKEKTFVQSIKDPRTTAAAEYRWMIETSTNVKEITYVQEQLNALIAQGFDDTFTPFWWKIKEFNKDYVQAQLRTINQDVIKHILPEELYNIWFDENIYGNLGTRLLDILTDPTIKELTDEDYRVYQSFLDAYLKTVDYNKDAPFNIPYNLIPASLRELEFKYYYDVLGINDINLVYKYLYTGASSNTAGWHTHFTNDINAVLMDFYKNKTSFNRIRRTLNHESGHNILERVVGRDSAEYTAFMDMFKNDFINTFGEENYNACVTYLKQLYSNQYAQRVDFERAVFEEAFTFSLAGDLPLLGLEITQAQADLFAKKLTNQLRDIAQNARNDLLESVRTSFKEISKQRSVKLPHSDLNFINPWGPVKEQQALNNIINRATDLHAQGALYNLFSYTPEDFITELAYRKRFITFAHSDIADPKLHAMYNKFNVGNTKVTSSKTVDVYKSAHGWYVINDKQNQRYWYVLGKEHDLRADGRLILLNTNPIYRKEKLIKFDEFRLVDDFLKNEEAPNFIVERMNKYDQQLYTLTGSHIGDSMGDTFTQADLEKFYLEHMPKEVQELLPSLEEYTNKSFFDAYIFNESVLGTAASRRSLGLYTSNQFINMRNTTQEVLGYLKPRSEYTHAVFDSMNSISSPNSVFAKFTNEELLEALRLNPDYKLVTLTYHKRWGVKVVEILPTSVEAIAKAREYGAVIIPTQVYKDMYNTINHRLGSKGMSKLWSKIIYCYKFGYLLRPGAWIRNWIDTNIKSRIELGSDFKEYHRQAKDTIYDVKKLKKSIDKYDEELMRTARKDYGALAEALFEDKHRVETFIQRRSHDGIIREDAIKAWFADPNTPKRVLTYDAYVELNRNFLSQGISGNVMADLYKSSGGDLWNTFTYLTGNIVEFGNKFETTHRLAMYLYELDMGADYTSALSKIAKTHFDYSFKTKAEQLSEMVFPFTTFSLRNASYWVEAIEKHPWLLRNYVHLMAPSWDFKDYTPEELARNKAVQSQILYGQLKLGEFNNKVITFKLNSSIQDALQMFSDPINNIYDKLAAPFALARDAIQNKNVNVLNAIPIAGPIIQNAQQMINKGTPLPSLIGVQNKPKQTGKKFSNGKWSNPNLSETDKYTDKTYRTPKYRKNVIHDAYATKGITRYHLNMYPIIDIAHDIKMQYSKDVYSKIKNRVQTDVYKGIRYRLRLDANRLKY